MWKKDRQEIIAYSMTFNKSAGSLYDKRLTVRNYKSNAKKISRKP